MGQSLGVALCFVVAVFVQVIMLVQTDVTPRVELENKLADLTDAQLSMLEQLFPRHIIEYMLAGVPSKNGRNLRDLANTHDQVMVLFCDVVGERLGLQPAGRSPAERPARASRGADECARHALRAAPLAPQASPA